MTRDRAGPELEAARPKKRKFSDPARTYAKRLERYRPGLVTFVLDELAGLYGQPDLGARGSTRPAS